MYRTLIVLPDGSELFSGVDQANVIQSCTITYSSNDGDDLMLGSVCAACLEAKVFSSAGDFSVAIGDVLTVYKVDDDGNRTQIGVFNVEVPTKVTKHIYKITAYDNVRKLDVDMTEWLRGLTGWPYGISTFTNMVAEECGLSTVLMTHTGQSESFKVYQFNAEDGVTGRQLMKWIAEICGGYCVASSKGKLEIEWYHDYVTKLYPDKLSGIEIGAEQVYYQGTLSYEDFQVEEIDAVLLREDNSSTSALWPAVEASNPYIITGNRLLMSNPSYLDGNSWDVLDAIKARFNGRKFVPFKVTIPELHKITTGRSIDITDREGNVIESYITSLTWKGHRMTLECTGSRTRANANAPSTLSNKQLMDHADQAAKKAVSSVSAESPDHPGCYCRTVDGKTEWINPPMVEGVEYRTTERYQGKVVYTKLVDFGSLPNAGSRTVSCGVAGANVVEWKGAILSGLNSASVFPWFNSSGTLLAIAYIHESDGIYVKTFADQSAAKATFTIKYTKE